MTSSDKEWIKGYACACAILTSLGGEDHSSAQSLVNEGGFEREHFIKAGVEKCDMDKIWPNAVHQHVQDSE